MKQKYIMTLFVILAAFLVFDIFQTKAEEVNADNAPSKTYILINKPEVAKSFSAVECTFDYNQNGYASFKKTKGQSETNTYITYTIGSANGIDAEIYKYMVVSYRLNKAAGEQDVYFTVVNHNGEVGSPYVLFRSGWEATESWKKKIISFETDKALINDNFSSGKITFIRFGLFTALPDTTMDIQYIAFFKSKDAAEKFDGNFSKYESFWTKATATPTQTPSPTPDPNIVVEDPDFLYKFYDEYSDAYSMLAANPNSLVEYDSDEKALSVMAMSMDPNFFLKPPYEAMECSDYPYMKIRLKNSSDIETFEFYFGVDGEALSESTAVRFNMDVKQTEYKDYILNLSKLNSGWIGELTSLRLDCFSNCNTIDETKMFIKYMAFFKTKEDAENWNPDYTKNEEPSASNTPKPTIVNTLTPDVATPEVTVKNDNGAKTQNSSFVTTIVIIIVSGLIVAAATVILIKKIKK